MRISVFEVISSLQKTEYIFWLDGSTFYLDEYIQWGRETERKKKYLRKKHYSRLRSRDSTIRLEDITIPSDVEKRVIDEYVSTLKVQKWTKN